MDPIKILIVDDDYACRQYLSIILGDQGFTTNVLSDPSLLFHQLEETPAELILLDINMPGIDGISLLKQIKKKPDLQQTEVIMVTGMTEDKILAECFKEGASDFVSKPLNPLTLNARIQASVNRIKLKQTQQELSQSIARYNAIISRSIDSIISVDLDGNITSFNPASEVMFGYLSSEVVGENISILMPESYHSESVNFLETYAVTEAGHSRGEDHDLSAKKKDGTLFSIELTANEIEYGTNKGFSAVIRDITERKAKESELRLHDKMLRNMSEGIYLTTAKRGELVYTNPALDKMFGYSKGELLGMHVSVLTAKAGSVNEQDVWEQVVYETTENGYWKGEIKVRAKNGRLFWADMSISSFDHQAFGSVWVCILEDITLRKNTMNKMARVVKYLDTVLLNLPLGVAILEGWELRFFRVNQQLADLNGLSIDALIGRDLCDVIPDSQESQAPEMRRVMVSGQARMHREFSMTLPTDPDHKLHLIDWLIPIEDRAIVAVVMDVTELKETQDQLLQSQKLESLGILAGGIAHDFNNDLAVISGNAELALEKIPEQSRANTQVRRILNASEKATSLVQQILSFSRKETKQYGPVNLKEVISESLDMIRALIPTNILIHEQTKMGRAFVKGDKTQIQQIIVNLCTNAYQAMELLGGVLTISLEVEGTFMKLCIKDNGPGIPNEFQENIFDPFFTTKDVGKGTGLGLSVVYRLVKQHGGKILIESKPEMGTVFSVYLPISDDIYVEQNSNENVTNGVGHILIVDDDPDVAELYQDCLTSAGYTVSMHESSLDALSEFKDKPDKFDLVLTDQIMPELTGDAFAQALLAIRPELPIVLTTGYSKVFCEKQAKKMGIKQYLEKPAKMGMLTKVISECLA